MVMILPRGESIKNFVYAGISDELRKQFNLVFFSVVPDAAIKKYLIDKCDAFYELPNIADKNKFASEIKQVLEIAHLNNLNSVTGNLKIVKDDLSSTKNWKSKIIRKTRKKIASFYKTQQSLVNLTNIFVRSNYKNKSSIRFEAILQKVNPDIVFNTSHVHNLLSLDLMYAVKKLNIKSAAFLFSWDNLTSQGRIIPNYDFYFAWNEKIKNDLLKLYPTISENNVFVTGTTQFDFHFNEEFIESKEKLYHFLEIPLHKKIVLYSTGMAYYTPKEHIIVKEIEKVLCKIDSDLQLVVRIYAKDDNTEYFKLRDENSSIIIPDHFWVLNHLTPTIKDIRLFNSLINHCFLGINVASTVSLDLAILNKPVINIAFNPPGENVYPNDYKKIYEFDHYKPIIASGAISLAENLEQLESQIKTYLNDLNFKVEERKLLTENFFGKLLRADKKAIFAEVFKKIID